jgi:hypothetical protein
MTVTLHQPSGLALSYFQLPARPGARVSAGTLELRNRTARRLTVSLDPIDAVTASTLGSAYDVRGLTVHGPARWTLLASRRVVLAPRGRATVAVTASPNLKAGPGDYLSGIGVQALGSPQQTRVKGNVAVSSVARYAVGLELRLPGPRHPLIRLTGAAVQRDPAGVSFSILARNPGNVILQGVHGNALITQGNRVAARFPMGPGTFVTGTSIAYPIPTPGEHPQQGTVYRVRAVLHYPGGTARLDTRVRFGRADALRQQAFGGPKAPGDSGFPVLAVVIAAVALALAAAGGTFLWRRRVTAVAPLRSLDDLFFAARVGGEPLSLIVVDADVNGTSPGAASVLRSRLRPADRLIRLPDGALLVAAPDTDVDTAKAIAGDLRRHLERAGAVLNGAGIEVYAADTDAPATELIERLTPRTPPRAAAP